MPAVLTRSAVGPRYSGSRRRKCRPRVPLTIIGNGARTARRSCSQVIATAHPAGHPGLRGVGVEFRRDDDGIHGLHHPGLDRASRIPACRATWWRNRYEKVDRSRPTPVWISSPPTSARSSV